MPNEKMKIALTSIAAAVFLTLLKLIVGITTRSLAIISEAIHSALDLGSTLITLFAVRVSDKPADEDHHYGHGKVENLSALVQMGLLLITCVWIVYEAVQRLIHGNVEVEVNIFSFAVIIVSIIVDVARSRVLLKAAKKYNSQVFEADAYHFSTDILSSAVVIIGLICVQFGFMAGDAIAALIVSIIVIAISIRLGKRAVAVLIDSAPEGMAEEIEELVKKTDGVVECKNIRVRASGSSYFVDLNIGIDKHYSHKEIQDVMQCIKTEVNKLHPGCDVLVSTYPADLAEFNSQDEALFDDIGAVINSLGICLNLHHMKVFNIGDRKHVVLHMEVKENADLNETHMLSHLIESKVKSALPEISNLDILVESMKPEQIRAEDITHISRGVVGEIESLLNRVPDRLNCHDIKIYSQNGKMTAFLHCGLTGEYSNRQLQGIIRSIETKIKSNIKGVEDVYVHVEPMNE